MPPRLGCPQLERAARSRLQLHEDDGKLVRSDLPPNLGRDSYDPEHLGWVALHKLGHSLHLRHATNLLWSRPCQPPTPTYPAPNIRHCAKCLKSERSDAACALLTCGLGLRMLVLGGE